MVFVNQSLLVKQRCLNPTQMAWFLGAGGTLDGEEKDEEDSLYSWSDVKEQTLWRTSCSLFVYV